MIVLIFSVLCRIKNKKYIIVYIHVTQNRTKLWRKLYYDKLKKNDIEFQTIIRYIFQKII